MTTENKAAERLRISEIFLSLQGEADSVGWPTVFVRLTGCPLRCHYCDTSYAFSGGKWWSLKAILAEVASLGARHVCVTGGEPLAQRDVLVLLQQLCDAGYLVSLETSGALDISQVDPRVSRVMDIKTPLSGEAGRNRYENIGFLQPHDQVKFVIGDRNDYEWAVAIANKYELSTRCAVLFSPSHGQIAARELAEWILDDRLPVRFQMQLHKLLWGDEPGR
ncbi:MAG: 7-carboxy-7-deazaguanine synthase QueE [Chromatiales bacterium]|nr:7-carboxy-7-deazaguanine synthase QueE [Gammaproteobacteria bacterium]MBW6477153.1 7-carboxy-7-deazaguanine synthase QueE [Chromatiales bacterium]